MNWLKDIGIVVLAISFLAGTVYLLNMVSPKCAELKLPGGKVKPLGKVFIIPAGRGGGAYYKDGKIYDGDMVNVFECGTK